MPHPHPPRPHGHHGGWHGHGGGRGGRWHGGGWGYPGWSGYGYAPYVVNVVEMVDPVANALAMLATRPDWIRVYCAEPTVAGRVQMVSIQLGRSIVSPDVLAVARRLDVNCGLTGPAGQIAGRPPSTAQYATAIAVGAGVGFVAYKLTRKNGKKRRKKR